eukprot:SAG31_NODE_31381_length_369_cov_0.437037_1_plen_28_part_01
MASRSSKKYYSKYLIVSECGTGYGWIQL